MWPEVQQVKQGNRHELVLSGPDVKERIQKDGLDSNIFYQKSLNFLEISFTLLNNLPTNIEKLEGLTRLCVCNNRLETLPDSIGKLAKLKFLDVSSNSLKELPAAVNKLSELQGLNANSNQLSQLPVLSACKNLAKVELSHNKFVEFPVQLCVSSLDKLAEINLSDNQLENLPGEIERLPSIKLLTLTNNNITVVPGEIARCGKLKDLFMQNNPVKDNRLKKLLNVDPPKYKQIYDYVKANCKLGVASASQPEKNVVTNGEVPVANGAGDAAVTAPAAVIKLPPLKDQKHIVISHAATSPASPVIRQTKEVELVRPHIVCCVVRRLNLTDKNLKKFLKIQTSLHDGICEKRMAATIATHDLSKVQGSLLYDGRIPKKIELHPLNRKGVINADALLKELKAEADQMRKDMKRNTISGIHKYLGLLGGKKFFPCLVDADGTGRVISFPPITNAEDTKVTAQTTDVLIEVTSDKSQPLAKTVMDTLLCEMVDAGLGEIVVLTPPSTTAAPAVSTDAGKGDAASNVPASAEVPLAAKDPQNAPSAVPLQVTQAADGATAVGAQWTRTVLHVQQVQVYVMGSAKSADDVNESLKVVYPSRVDLQEIPAGIEVVRLQADQAAS